VSLELNIDAAPRAHFESVMDALFRRSEAVNEAMEVGYRVGFPEDGDDDVDVQRVVRKLLGQARHEITVRKLNDEYVFISDQVMWVQYDPSLEVPRPPGWLDWPPDSSPLHARGQEERHDHVCSDLAVIRILV
jgi:hypothetical protein